MEYEKGILQPALVLTHEELDDFLNTYANKVLTGNSKEERLDRMQYILRQMSISQHPWLYKKNGSIGEHFFIHEIKWEVGKHICLVYKDNTYKTFKDQDVYTLYAETEDIKKEFEEKLGEYVPDDFEWDTHIGTLIIF